MNDTFQDDFSELPKPGLRTHGFAERVDCGEDGFAEQSLEISMGIEPVQKTILSRILRPQNQL